MESFLKMPKFVSSEYQADKYMGINVLKMLIETACADGVVTERERMHIEEQARLHNISKEEIDSLIQHELERVDKEILAQRSGIVNKK